MFHWHKIARVFEPTQNAPWCVSHAANPFPVSLGGASWRIFYTCRDAQNRSHIAFLDAEIDNGFRTIGHCERPVLEPGDAGMFDDSGSAMGWLLEQGGRQYLYYLGWNLKVIVPWQNSIGLAISEPGSAQFKKVGRAPIVDRSNEDPYSISYPSVLVETGKFRMWYGSNLTWGKTQESMSHVIKYAESQDGIAWTRDGRVCIGLEHPNEYALSKPFVLKIDGLYRMWYSYRASGDITTYRVGYASSPDGLLWTRQDHLAGIDVSPSGWDSEMICYPAIFRSNEKYYMLYNGNGYGKSGFGLAIENGNNA